MISTSFFSPKIILFGGIPEAISSLITSIILEHIWSTDRLSSEQNGLICILSNQTGITHAVGV